MLRYIAGRVLLIIPTLIVVIFVIFVILNITPENPRRIILGMDAKPEAVDALNKQLGMYTPSRLKVSLRETRSAALRLHSSCGFARHKCLV
ncbi:MAG: hypothetical protein LBS19_11675 [Clostridiales bacterium]|jgi:ABC-type dipeptide/oligopeptide/nickel transport system permease component|nr:hypothetical protein [Clostridiales bacterium]